MDPLLALAGTYAAERTLSLAESKFGEFVVARWTRRRSKKFIQAFFEAAREEFGGGGTDDADKQLTKVMEDETASEMLFEYYRKAVLSASREFGPRIIGLLTARLVLDKRRATWAEAKVSAAAEQLDDGELGEVADDFRRLSQGLAGNTDDGSVTIEIARVDYDLSRDFSFALTPFDLEELGGWASKLRNLGMLHLEVKQEQWSYREDGERYIDEDGTAGKVTTYLIYSSACRLLVEYVERVRTSEKTPGNPLNEA